MNTQNRNLIIVVVAIIVLVVVGVWYSMRATPPSEEPSATSTPISSATSTTEIKNSTTTFPAFVAWKIYRDKKYTINYKSDMVVGVVPGYIATLATGAIATQFEFPKSYYSGTFAGAAVTVVITNTACSKSVDGIYSYMPAKTVVKNGVSFTVTNISDAGAGHFYYTTEYGTMKDGLCYRIALNEHLVNPSPVYGDDKAKIDAALAANAATRTKLAGILAEMVGTFAFAR